MRVWVAIAIVMACMTSNPCEAEAASLEQGEGYAGYGDGLDGGPMGYGDAGGYGTDTASATTKTTKLSGAEQSPVARQNSVTTERSTKKAAQEPGAKEKSAKQVKEAEGKKREKGIKEVEAKKVAKERVAKEKSAKQVKEVEGEKREKGIKEVEAKKVTQELSSKHEAQAKTWSSAKRKRWLANPTNDWPWDFKKHCTPNSHSLSARDIKSMYPLKPCPSGMVWACTGKNCQGLHFDTSKQNKAVSHMAPFSHLFFLKIFALNCRVFTPAVGCANAPRARSVGPETSRANSSTPSSEAGGSASSELSAARTWTGRSDEWLSRSFDCATSNITQRPVPCT